MARYSIPKIESKSFRSWAFVLIAGGLLTVIAILDRGGLGDAVAGADGSTGCQLEVAVAELNVRSGPSAEATQVDTLRRGDRIDGTRVVTDGFRELEGGRWASDEFLIPLPGTNCA